MRVKLTSYEMLIAAQVGARRHVEALERNLPDRHGARADRGWQLHVEGACGEMAFAKGLGWYWDGSVNTFKAPDVGSIQVRTRSAHARELYIRRGERGAFALVTGTAPSYWLRGWFPSSAVSDAWLRDHGGRESAFFIPHAELRPLDMLQLSDAALRAAADVPERRAQ